MTSLPLVRSVLLRSLTIPTVLLFLWIPTNGGAQTPPKTISSGPKLIDYTVRRGDTLQSIAKRLYNNAGRVDLILRHNNLGQKPALQEGQILHVPAETGPDARLTYVKNLVDAYTPKRHPGQKDEALFRGHKVSTLDHSAAEIVFSDDTRVQLSEHSLLVVAGESSDTRGGKQPGPASSDTTLLQGSLRAHLGELAGTKPRVFLATPSSRVAITPGGGHLAVDPEKTTRVAVHQGKWQVGNERGQVSVPAGYGTRIAKGRPPAPVRKLPPAPIWTEPPPQITLWPGKSVALGARFADGGQGSVPVVLWHIQVARDERFNDTVLDQKVPVTQTEMRVSGLVVGTYFSRVWAIDQEQLLGPPSAVARFEVREAQIVPAQVAKGLPAQVVPPEGLYCALDEAPLVQVQRTGSLILSPGRDHTLRCSPTTAPALGQNLPIPAASAGPLLPQFTAAPVAWSKQGGTRDLVLRLLDAAKAPQAGIQVQVKSSAGTMGPLQESAGEPGSYRSTLSFPLGTQAIAVQYQFGQATPAETFEVTLAKETPPPPPPPPAAKELPRAIFAEAAALLGVTFTNPSQGSFAGGPGLEAGMRFTHTSTPGPLSLALRIHSETRILLPSSPQQLLGFAIPLRLRLLPSRYPILPYLMLAPELQIEFPANQATRFRAGTFFGIGADVPFTKQFSFFIEGGYRLIQPIPSKDETANDGPSGAFGLRKHFN